ncbi:uncharacterized protein N7496_003177 [Penicillium cataractarum]|uniref:Uncharacterized protein n=1 Tax=Penicillium cataractarum TaxID=2100454 RepID=A0A9W9SNW9_9EURO|nr:uncharacterized protein N7496_003177 [Penicillium cataractarum]KAJ5380749.1 hypothetical protein N7496_003177 [Penicillium cataractarum]
MTSFTEKAHQTFVIGDDLAALGSASNPIVIHVNEVGTVMNQAGLVPLPTLRSWLRRDSGRR